jgi:hypothetical protein
MSIYIRYPKTNFRDDRNTDMSKFDYEKYNDILEYIDSYALGLELAEKKYHYSLYRDMMHTDIFYAHVNHWDFVDTNSGFMITFYQNYKESIYCKVNISISIDMKNFSSHKIAGKLRGKVEKWRKEKENKFHNYTITFRTVRELEDIYNVFSAYLP